MTGSVDAGDLAYVRARAPARIVSGEPAPRGGRGGINPHVSRFLLADGSVMDVFHVKPVYYETKEGTWRPLAEVAAHHGNRRIVLYPDALERGMSTRFFWWLVKRQALFGSRLRFGYPNAIYWGIQPEHMAFADSATFFPDPSVEVTSVDGYVFGQNASYATAHALSSGTAADTSGVMAASVDQGVTTAAVFTIFRSFTLFDTSLLGDDAAVTAATVSLCFSSLGDTDNDGDDWVNVVQSSPASNTAIAGGDFDQCGAISNPTEGATRVDISGITANSATYTDFALNATGLGWIAKTGITKLGWREGHDAINAAPGAGLASAAQFLSAEAAGGTTTAPKLVVTYTAAAIVHVASAASTTVGTTSTTITIPTVASGDDLYVLVTSRDHTVGTAKATCTDNDGGTWTEESSSSDRKGYLFWRKATGATSAKTITIAGAVGSVAAVLSVFRGGAAGDPTTNVSLQDNASGTESHTGFTPSNAHSMVCFGVCNTANDNPVTAETAATLGTLLHRVECLSTGGSDSGAAIASTTQGTAAATGAITWAQVNGTTKSIAWAIKPAGGASGTIAQAAQKAAQSLSVTEAFTGTVSSAAKRPAQAMTGVMHAAGTMSSSVPRARQSLTAEERFPAAIAQQARRAAQVMTGASGFSAVVVQMAPAARQILTGAETIAGSAAQSAPKVAQQLSAAEITEAAIASKSGHAAQALAATETLAGSIASAAPKVAQSVAGDAAGASAMASTAPRARASLAGAESFLGTIASVPPRARQAAVSVLTIAGSAASRAAAAVQNLAGGEGFAGTIAQAAKRAAQALIGALQPGGAIAQLAARARQALTGRVTVTPPPDARTLIVRAQDRMLIVESDRRLTVAAQDRMLTVESDRFVTITAQDRIDD